MKSRSCTVKKRPILKTILAIFCILLLSQNLWAQPDEGDYQTATVGGSLDWNTASSWDYYTTALGWTNDVSYPGQNAVVGNGVVTIRGTGTPSVSLSGTPANSIGALIVESAASLDGSGYNLEVGGTSSISGTITFGSGQKTLTGAVTINSGATFNAGTGTISFGGNLTISGIGSGTTFTESTATFEFPENVAYVITADGNVSFDKVAHTTTSLVGARTIEFQGSGATRNFDIKTSFTRAGRSLGTIETSADLRYVSDATLIYSPSGATMTVDINEWPTTVTLPGRPTNVTLTGSQDFTLDQARTIPGTLTLNQTGGNFIVSGVALTVNGTLDRRTSGITGITLSGGTLSYATAGSNLSYNTSASTTIGAEWDQTNPPENVIVNISSGTLSGTTNKIIPKDLTLSVGTIDLGTTSRLTVEGTVSGGVISGSATIADNTELFLGNGATGNSYDQSVTGSLTLKQLTVYKTLGLGTGTTVTLNGSANLTFTADAALDVMAGTLDLNGSGRITNPGNVDVTVTGTLRTGGTTLTNLKSLTATSGTLVFDGTTASENLPVGSVANVEIDNNDGVLTSTGTLSVGTNLNLTDGAVTTTSNNILLIDDGATVTASPSGFGTTRMIKGPLQKEYGSTHQTAAFTYPVGFSSTYHPATFDYISNDVTLSIIQVEAISGDPTGNPPTDISTIASSHYYTVTEEGTGGDFTYDFTGHYDGTGFLPETRNKLLVQTSSGPNEYSYPHITDQTVNTTDKTVKIEDALSALPTPNGIMAFGSSGTSLAWTGGVGNWNTAGNWSPSGIPSSTDALTINTSGDEVTINNGTTAYAQTLTLASNAKLILKNTSPCINIGGSSWDNSLTTIGSSTTIEYQNGPVNVDSYGNLTINGAAGTTGSGAITVGGNLVKDNATAFTGSHTITVTGNYTNTTGDATYNGGGLTVNGSPTTITSGTVGGTIALESTAISFGGGDFGGTVTLSGSGQQTISGTTPSFNNLTVNNSAGIVVSSATSVSGSLTLNNGLVTTSSLLTLVSGTSGNTNSYVNGPLAISGTSSKTFPIGKNGIYKPITVTGTTSTTQFELFNSDPSGTAQSPLLVISSVRYWQGSGTISSGSITLPYGGDDGPIVTIGNLRVAQSSTVNGDYFSRGPSGGGSDGSVISDATLSSLGFFTLGSVTTDNSLPVSLTTFTANAEFSQITLNWQTESEIDNQGFNIYRASGTNPDN